MSGRAEERPPRELAPRDAPLVLLGPQEVLPSAGSVLRRLGVKGTVALVTAGWRDDESDDEQLERALGVPVVNLRLYDRAEAIFDEDPGLRAAYRERQDRLQQLQALHRLRLAPAISALRDLLAAEGDRAILGPEQDDAIDALRRLDAHHVERLRSLHGAFELRERPGARPAVRRHVEEIRRHVERAEALVIAGGHVIVLLNRLRLFGAVEAARNKPIVAWSAGAMALSSRVLAFHDRPPQGEADPEILDVGLGVAKGLVPLPHARERLDLENPRRVALLARRVAPDLALTLDEGAELSYEQGRWEGVGGALRLARDGALEGQ